MGSITSMENSKKALPESRPSSSNNQPQRKAVSGSGMDRKVLRSKKRWPQLLLLAMLPLALWFIYHNLTLPGGKTLNVKPQNIMIASVSQGIFEDFIPVRGQVVPAKTLYLDAIEGGRVERILVEDGATLKAGDLIVELSNASLQLNVLGNEARVAEQLNNMRSIELSLEQNRLQHKRNLADINYQIKMLSRQLAHEQQLVKTGAVAKTQVEDTRDTLQWYQKRLALTLESQASDARMQEEQLKFLKETSSRLEGNLAISRKNLDNMNVRAPVDGTLSGFDVQVGQSIARGERLGQIDTPNNYKLSAHIDEFYLSRVALGQKASFDNYQLAIAKIYPQVQNGQFEVDFKFIGNQPQGIRRGQSIQTKLTLGDNSEALLLPNGAFFQDSGGNWVYVVSTDGSEAVKRPVRMGRRNSRFIEVLDGLQAGERVVISSYTSYRDMERLALTQ